MALSAFPGGRRGAKRAQLLSLFVSQSGRLASQRGPCRRRLHGAPLGKAPRALARALFAISLACSAAASARRCRRRAEHQSSCGLARMWSVSRRSSQTRKARAALAPLSVCNSLGLSPLYRLSNFLSGRGGTWGKASGAEVSVKGCLAAPKRARISAAGRAVTGGPGHSPFQWSITYCPASVLPGL